MTFAGLNVLITGVGRAGQVGESVAKAFAERGATVLLVAHSMVDADARADELRSAGYRAVPLQADLTKSAEVAALAERVRRDHGDQLSALVNVAGGFGMTGPVDASDPEAWQKQFAINVTTAYHATRSFLPLLRRARGSIVYFASEAVLPGARVASMAAYAAAKSAVVALMHAVAQEERGAGVRANAVAPGTVRTAANAAATTGRGAPQPLVEREDLASAVLFLCSDEARAITGQVLRLS